ncbi:MAG: acetyl-CoA carboxylase carboxyl transferase subunit alpha, partial [Spirochaetaceae bacterium]|nr:acetyl-CoA carboxylase carboxyl transferase subunit alpha [Spirochaetaceae bacterium]
KQAEKFHRPIVTFIDTQGAYPGIGAEERGIGEAIARNLMEFSQLKTPIICFVIGEGGSGGALGVGVGDKIYMLENAIYSVISPEGFASILLRDSSRAKDAASIMKITSGDILALKVVNGVIPEPEGGAHISPKTAAASIRAQILADLKDLMKRTPSVLVKYRNRKIRKIGFFYEGEE